MPTTEWLIAFAIGGVIVVGWLRWFLPPYQYKRVHSDHLVHYLGALLHHGFDNGYMIVRIFGSQRDYRFVQLCRYNMSDGVGGLEFVFPLVQWSEPYYDRLKGVLQNEGVDFRTQSTWRNDIKENLSVDVGEDLDLGAQVCMLTVVDVFGQSLDTTLEVTLHNVRPTARRAAR